MPAGQRWTDLTGDRMIGMDYTGSHITLEIQAKPLIAGRVM